MKTHSRAGLLPAAIMLMVAVAVASGCSERDQAVRDSIREANVHLKRFGEHIRELQQLQKELQDLSGLRAEEATSKVEELLSREREDEEAALGEAKKAREELEKARKLDVSRRMKTYLDMEIGAVEEEEKAVEYQLEATNLKLNNIDMILGGTPLDAGKLQLLSSVNELEVGSRDHFARAAELHERANRYYEDKKLGK